MKLLGCLAAFMCLMILIGLSWVGVCGFLYLLTLLFKLTFDLLAATLVWVFLGFMVLILST